MAKAWVLDTARAHVARADVSTALAGLGDPATAIWLNLTPEEFEPLAPSLNFHPRAIEDALKASEGTTEAAQRAKLDRFPNHFFLYLFRASVVEGGQLQLREVPLFVNHNTVIVVDRSDPFSDEELEERWSAYPELLKYGIPTLLYAALDVVIDSHLETVDALADVVDSLEDDLFAEDGRGHEESRDVQLRSFQARKALVRLRRVTQPMREIVSGIMRREDAEHTMVQPLLLPYFQDLYDHVLRVNDTIEGLRELITTIYETRLALYDHTLNTVTRQLAAWAAIIAVPTAVTGFYGQNVPYPGYLHISGFWTSTILWLGVSTTLYVAFKRRHWL